MAPTSLSPKALNKSLLTVFLFFCLAICCAAEQTIADFQYRKVGNINIQADGPVDEPFLLGLIEIAPNVDILTPPRIRKSIDLLYQTGNFTNILVDARLSGERVDLTFILRLVYRFEFVRLEGNTGISRGRISRRMSLRKREPYSPEKVLKGRDDILKVLNENGYFQARVNPDVLLHRRSKQAEVVYNISAGPQAVLQDVQFRGDPYFTREKLLEVIDSEPGKTFRPFRLDRDLLSLETFYEKNGFLERKIEIAEQKVDELNRVQLVLDIQAGSQLVLNVEGYNISDGKVREIIPVWSERSYNDDTLEEGKRSLIQYMQGRGHYDAIVTYRKEFSEEKILITYGIEPGRYYEIREIRIAGNTALSREDLEKLMATEETKLFRARHLVSSTFESDLEQVLSEYRRRGFLFARWKKKEVVRADDRTIRIDLEVEEGDQITVSGIRLKGNEVIPTDFFLERFRQKVGSPISEAAIKADAGNMIALYSDRGYPKVRVTNNVLLTADKTRALIEYRITEGPQVFVNRIVLSGNWRTERHNIEENLLFAEGDALSLRKIVESRSQLYALDIFDRVELDVPRPDNLKPNQDVFVRLTESKPYTISYGIGFQTFDLLRGVFSISNRNWLGTARTVGLQARAGFKEGRVLFTFTDPHLLFHRVNSNFLAIAERRVLTSFSYDRYAAGFSVEKKLSREQGFLEVGQSPPPAQSLFLRYDFEDINTRCDSSQMTDQDDTGCEPSLSPFDRRFLDIHLSSISGAYVRDGRDNQIDPTRGRFHSSTLQYASNALGSESDFLKYFGQFQYYIPLSTTVVATSFRVGLARGFRDTVQLPLSQRFFAGGGRSIRGFELDTAGPLDDQGNPLGGNALIILNLEYRFPLFSNLGAVAFFDTGNVFPLVSDIDLTDLRETAGLGLRYLTPIGPVTLDWGYKLDRRFQPARESAFEFFLSVGHAF